MDNPRISQANDGPKNTSIGFKMAEFTNNLRTIALQRPYDAESQRRAQAAVDLYYRTPGFPPLVEPQQPTEIHQPRSVVLSLPIEIYRIITHYATMSGDIENEKDHGLCLNTIFALTRTCRVFQEIVEAFLFSLAVEPRRARLVQELDLYWHHEPCNSWVMVDTAQACPNFSALNLVQLRRTRSSDISVDFYNQRFDELAELLNNCPFVTSFRFKLERLNLRQPKLCPVLPNEKRFLKFAQQLTHAKVYGCAEWFQHAILPHLSSNLTSFSITSNETLSGFFPQLYHQSPALQTLYIGTFGRKLNMADEVVESLQLWGPTLRRFHLNLSLWDEIKLGLLLPWMSVLEELILGELGTVRTEDMMAIAHASLPRLRIIDLYGVELASPELNATLIEMMSRHAATIQAISFPNGYKMDIEVLRSLRQLKSLEVICAKLEEEIQLLVACTKLKPTFPAENYGGRVVKEHTLMAGDVEKCFFNTGDTFRTWGSSCFGELEYSPRK